MVKSIAWTLALLVGIAGCVHREVCVEGTEERDGRCVPVGMGGDAGGGTDGGGGTDSGGVDAGTGTDSGTPDMDAGGGTDAGSGDDAGSGTDAGSDAGGGLPGRIVFATSTTYTGNLGGLSGADTRCQTLATMAGLEGTFVAWLSDDSTDAAERIGGGRARYIRTDGAEVASDWLDFLDDVVPGPAVPINLDQNGDPVTYDLTWTATNIDGTHRTGAGSGFGNCSNWTSTSGNGGYGRVASTTHTWTENGALNCNIARGLFCIED